MRILITGASGLLGAHLASGLADRHTVLGVDRHPWWGDLPVPLQVGDLSDPAFRERTFRSFKPEALLHCAAMANVDACEQDPAGAFSCNAELTARLAESAAPDCLFVYLSTDGVFRGERPLHAEEDPPDPITVYGRSKLQGEREVQQRIQRHLIVRTNFYGWSSGRKKTFAEWLVRSLEGGEPITLFSDFFFTPLYVMDFVECLRLLLESGATGLFHVAGGERVSKSRFGLRLAELAGFSTRAVRVGSLHSAPLVAPRPADMSLACGRFVRRAGRALPGLDEGLRRFLQDRGRPLSLRSRMAQCIP